MIEKPSLYLSNMTLAGIRNPAHLIWGYLDFAQVAEGSGVDFIEQHPLQTPRLELERRSGHLTRNRHDSRIRALHTSWRGQEHWFALDGQNDVWHHPARMLAAYSMALLPHRSDRRVLLAIQDSLGLGRLPLVEYTEDVRYKNYLTAFGETVVQIADSQMEKWGTPTVTDFLKEAEARNAKIALDLTLFRKLPEGQGDTWRESVVPILNNPDTVEVHFPLVREDFGDNGSDLRELLAGNKESALFQFAEILRDVKWNGRLVFEGSIDGILQSVGEAKKIPAKRRITQALSDAISPVKEILQINS